MSAAITTLMLYMSGPVGTVSAIPASFIGRYEADPRDCRISSKERDDDEMAQGGSLVVIKPQSVYFAQWVFPVQSVTSISDDIVSVELLHDVDADGTNIEITRQTLSLRGKLLTMSSHDGSSRYYRCKNGI